MGEPRVAMERMCEQLTVLVCGMYATYGEFETLNCLIIIDNLVFSGSFSRSGWLAYSEISAF